jgi:hypothetical protein
MELYGETVESEQELVRVVSIPNWLLRGRDLHQIVRMFNEGASADDIANFANERHEVYLREYEQWQGKQL